MWKPFFLDHAQLLHISENEHILHVQPKMQVCMATVLKRA